jgi:predicted methyltransferase
MMRSSCLLVVPFLAACASGSSATSGSSAPDPTNILSATDRTERDRGMDAHRKAADMLRFFGPSPGMKVADLGAGGGYSTELFARAVGPSGSVIAQDPPAWDGAGLQRAWQARLASPANAKVTHVLRDWNDPLPPEATNLDAVYAVAIYHDEIAEHGDPDAFNAAVFRALKPGGIYGIIDNSAPAGNDDAPGKLHRIDEKTLRAQVERAGFRLADQAEFLRNGNDTRDWTADPGDAPKDKVHTQDRFALKFVKP